MIAMHLPSSLTRKKFKSIQNSIFLTGINKIKNKAENISAAKSTVHVITNQQSCSI